MLLAYMIMCLLLAITPYLISYYILTSLMLLQLLLRHKFCRKVL